MPLIKVHTPNPVPPDLLDELSTVVAESIGKPEKYVMVVATTAELRMSGTDQEAIFAEVKSIGGLDRIVNHEITMKLCILFSDHLGVPADRVYVVFESVAADHWGWDGSIFG